MKSFKELNIVIPVDILENLSKDDYFNIRCRSIKSPNTHNDALIPLCIAKQYLLKFGINNERG